MNTAKDKFLEMFPNGKIVELKPPPWGYCIMKRIYQLNNPKYKHLPQFASAEEQGRGNPVIIRHGSGEEICHMDWEEFHKLYQID